MLPVNYPYNSMLHLICSSHITIALCNDICLRYLQDDIEPVQNEIWLPEIRPSTCCSDEAEDFQTVTKTSCIRKRKVRRRHGQVLDIMIVNHLEVRKKKEKERKTKYKLLCKE